jgi:hypothetical protein
LQDKHYDRHGYWTEKIKALRAWEKRLKTVAEGGRATVTSIKRAVRA